MFKIKSFSKLQYFLYRYKSNTTFLKGETRKEGAPIFYRESKDRLCERGIFIGPFVKFVLSYSNIRLSTNSLLFNQHWLYANVSTNVSTERTASEKRFPKTKRGLAGMIYLSYICTRNSARCGSSAG